MRRWVGLLVLMGVAAAGFWLLRDRVPWVLFVGKAAPTPVQTAEAMAVPIYFMASDGSGLVAESRDIPHPGDIAEGIRASLQELLRGPQDPKHLSPIPDGTKLREVYVDQRKHAYCDFSHELRDNHPGGSFAEQMTVFSIVNTLTTDFPAVRRVHLLIDGAPAETLAGHLDISHALSKRLLLLSKLSGN